MKTINIIWIVSLIIFFGVTITATAQNQDRIQNCITVHEFISDRIYIEKEQALRDVYRGAGVSVIGAWLSMGGSNVFSKWGGIFDFLNHVISLQDHRVTIDFIEELYWQRTIQNLQDLNNCINWS